jgi:soluble lytic murein transglycosylase-like protein
MRLRGTLFFLGLIFACAAWSDVYMQTDAQGIEHYTNQPGLGGYALIVAVLQVEGTDNRAKTTPIADNVTQYAPQIEHAAEEYKVDKALVHAVITAESGYNPKAVSRTGAQGLMQLMPETAKRYEVKDMFDPAQNIQGGTRYLRDLLDKFDQNVELALAAYNAGENAVTRYGNKIPPYPETKAYVPKVMSLFSKYRQVL